MRCFHLTHLLLLTITYYYLLLLTITYYYLLLLTTTYYYLLLLTITYYHLLPLTTTYYHLLPLTTTNYHLLPLTTTYYHLLPLTITYYHLLLLTIIDCKFNCHKKCADRVPNNCLGLPTGGGGLSETGSDAGDALLDNDSALDAMSMDEEKENGGGSTPEDEPSIKPQLRFVVLPICGSGIAWDRSSPDSVPAR